MKTHEIGISSFASVMINGKEKHWDSREWGGEVEFFVWAAEWAWSCAFNEESKQERQKKTKKNKQDRNKESSVCIQSVLSKGSHLFQAFICTLSCLCISVFTPLLVQAAHLKTPHISVALGERRLNKEEPHQNQPLLSAPLCSADPWWSFQVARKLAQNNSRLHRNYILLTVCSFTCVSTVCVYNAWTRHEQPVTSSGLWALCLSGCSPDCCVSSLVNENESQEQSAVWFFYRF